MECLSNEEWVHPFHVSHTHTKDIYAPIINDLLMGIEGLTKIVDAFISPFECIEAKCPTCGCSNWTCVFVTLRTDDEPLPPPLQLKGPTQFIDVNYSDTLSCEDGLHPWNREAINRLSLIEWAGTYLEEHLGLLITDIFDDEDVINSQEFQDLIERMKTFLGFSKEGQNL
jgi:hypothetical protein